MAVNSAGVIVEQRGENVRGFRSECSGKTAEYQSDTSALAQSASWPFDLPPLLDHSPKYLQTRILLERACYVSKVLASKKQTWTVLLNQPLVSPIKWWSCVLFLCKYSAASMSREFENCSVSFWCCNLQRKTIALAFFIFDAYGKYFFVSAQYLRKLNSTFCVSLNRSG